MTHGSLTLDTDPDGIATLSIQRAEYHNAFDDVLIEELIDALDKVAGNSSVRVLILRSQGKSFSAGADLNWMKRMADYSTEENLADAMRLATLMRKLDSMQIPTIARVQGSAFGGGVGLVACCDIAVCTSEAVFCLSEVRLGLIPAVISPYVVAAIGERASRRYFLTAERFDAYQALKLNLVHEVTEQDQLDTVINGFTDNLLKGGVNAISAAKELIKTVSKSAISDDIVKDTVQRIAAIRASAEGKEGLSAFLEKRSPDWSRNQKNTMGRDR